MKRVCPDSQILSIYMDNELPSPWKEKLESHLESCSGCREKLEGFKRLHGKLLLDGPLASDPVIEAAKNKTWQNLQSGAGLRNEKLNRNLSRPKSDIWRRRLSIPLPAAAAAAVILILLAALWVRRAPDNSNGFASQPQEPAARENFIVAAEDDMPGIIPAMDFNSVLQYLGSDGSEIIILRLPESKNFLRSGEPAIIRAADYTRR
ncbi:MAG: zf-HC2 domain-containing protein [Treponema sp.]|nr:zf-HC2 domain-containing protein [Treponema sp.]